MKIWRHEFWKILLKFDLRVCGKVPFLIFLHEQEIFDTSKNLSWKCLSKPL